MRAFLRLLLFLVICIGLVFIAGFVSRTGWFNGLFQPSLTATNNTEVKIEEIVPADGLHPVVADYTEKLIEEAGAIGISILITDGYRTPEEQDRLYRKGRDQNGRIVTNAKGGQSYHNFGLAIDFALLDEDGEPLWDIAYDGNKNGEPDWFEVAELAKELGFEWGGDWANFTDYPHLQMTFGYSIEELQHAQIEFEESELP